ncbi:MAG: twin-arginine translocase subunit TatC [Candidatus Rokubacteria bacterium]|nr:twin-arginine translocase subunit TatC [Candidatus Rokubacteria bacterium]
MVTASKAGNEEPEPQDGKMPFLAHLGELRRRIIVSLIALGVGCVATFNYSDRIINWLARPMPVKLAFLEPTEPFWVNMKVALVAGAFIALPIILYEIWAFVEPGLMPRERKLALPFIVVGSFSFLLGAAFALTVIVPFAIKFLVSFKTENLVATISVNRYVDFVLKFTIAFGLVFELPLGLTLGARLGVVTPEFLARNRKYAILINFVIAAILTPTPDAFNQLLMAGPLCLLYEVGIIAARVFGGRRTKQPA